MPKEHTFDGIKPVHDSCSSHGDCQFLRHFPFASGTTNQCLVGMSSSIQQSPGIVVRKKLMAAEPGVADSNYSEYRGVEELH